MALIQCPECGKEISDKARKCPNCDWMPEMQESNLEQSKVKNLEQEDAGRRVSKNVSKNKSINNRFLIIIVIALIIVVITLLWENRNLSSDSNKYNELEKADVNGISESTSTTDFDEVINSDDMGNEETEMEAENQQQEFIETANNKNTYTDIIEFSGNGDTVLKDIQIPDGLYRVYLENNGTSNFVVYAYNGDGTKDPSWANEVGNYKGYTVLSHGISNGMIEVRSSGDWKIKILSIESSGTSNLAGKGDTVSPYFYLKSGLLSVDLSNIGEGNFIVYIYDETGRKYTSLANEIGNYNGTTVFNQGEDNVRYFLEVISEGDWTINFNLDENVTYVLNE